MNQEYLTQDMNMNMEYACKIIEKMKLVSDDEIFDIMKDFIDDHFDCNGEITRQYLMENYNKLENSISVIDDMFNDFDYDDIENDIRDLFENRLNKLYDLIYDIYAVYRTDN